ncbi:hypothetical protein B0H13DRAFT_1880899 [Mycena leptocephala]|nr:hypothetical protein B0H13DRAFT_1880899 [Mycena leptocephala]
MKILPVCGDEPGRAAKEPHFGSLRLLRSAQKRACGWGPPKRAGSVSPGASNAGIWPAQTQTSTHPSGVNNTAPVWTSAATLNPNPNGTSDSQSFGETIAKNET